MVNSVVRNMPNASVFIQFYCIRKVLKYFSHWPFHLLGFTHTQHFGDGKSPVVPQQGTSPGVGNHKHTHTILWFTEKGV